MSRVYDNVAQLVAWRSGLPPGTKVVTTNGCFDLLHVGHLRYLKAARAMGDVLIVALNTDNSVRCLEKAPDRPIIPQDQRAELLAALEPVDAVVLFDDPTPVAVLEAIRPDIHVKGGDYNADTLPETPTLRSIGTDIRFVPLEKGFSTTALIQKIRQQELAT